jgi:ABC-type transport system substrate-binding protein
MFSRRHSKKLFLLCVIFVLALTACSTAVAPDNSATTVEESQPAETQEEAATEAEEAAPEEAAAETESEEEDTSQEVITDVVEKSQAAQAGELAGGTTVVSEEEVSSPRDHFGGEYRSVTTSDAVSFHPYLTTDTTSSTYQGLIYTGGLLRLDENTLEYIPNMAESYTISEDGLTFTFNLRQDMLWSDGIPITANDFQWTFEQVTNPDNGFPYLSQLGFITSYKALDEYTLEI